MKKLRLVSCSAACLLAILPAFSQEQLPTKLDTVYANFRDIKMHVTPRHDYTQTFVTKLFMAQAEKDTYFKRRDNGKTTVRINCEQAVEIIKGMDNITLGMPKVVYLVGWQYNGHDSKYPAFFDGNYALKRPQDRTALESIRWVMSEGKKYNTSVSVHINMIDAYEDSPLWDKYVENNVISRTEYGSLRGGEWGYPISYAQEWSLGFTQERIDKLLSILPIQEAGTIHIDAFHSAVPQPVKKPDGSWGVEMQSPISPYLDFTQEDEIQAQRNIIKYFDSKGVDVTTEGVPQKELLGIFDGYQTMGWWFKGADIYLNYTPQQMCGGYDPYSGEWGRLFGTNLNAEHVFLEERPLEESFEDFKGKFCTMSAIFNFLNRFERKYRVEGEDYFAVQFSDNVKSEVNKGKYTIRKDGVLLVEDNNVFIPAMWLENKSMIAYSADGYKNRTWTVPAGYFTASKVTLYRVDHKGKVRIGQKNVGNGKISLSLQPNEMVLITQE